MDLIKARGPPTPHMNFMSLLLGLGGNVKRPASMMSRVSDHGCFERKGLRLGPTWKTQASKAQKDHCTSHMSFRH